ncbi:MAG: hypothetical protein ACREFP_23460 [Acetobacteraceae bacterium]
MIEVEQTGRANPFAFAVTVRDAAGETRHRVTMSQADYERLTNGRCPPEHCIKAALRFLLDREPKEAILARFDISVIPRYFPNFAHELPRYIASTLAARDGA